MYSKVKLFGHPLHPMLVPFPIAFYVAACVACVTYAFQGDPLWFRLAFAANVAGIAMAVVAAGAGFFRMVASHSERHGERERARYRPVGAPVDVAPVDVDGRSSRSNRPSAYPSGAHPFPIPGMAHFRQCWGTVRCAQSSFRSRACRNDDGSVTLVQAMPDPLSHLLGQSHEIFRIPAPLRGNHYPKQP